MHLAADSASINVVSVDGGLMTDRISAPSGNSASLEILLTLNTDGILQCKWQTLLLLRYKISQCFERTCTYTHHAGMHTSNKSEL